MASCLQKIPSGNESRARKEKMMKGGIPNYRERSRLNKERIVTELFEINTAIHKYKKTHPLLVTRIT